MSQPDLEDLLSRAVAHEARAIARLISLIEADSPLLRQLALPPPPAEVQVIGLTGPPGVGKSTTTSALVGQLRAADQRVGVLAVDPSSPYTGGALLGDRVRMSDHALDPDVVIRSMATRGQLGGLARATPQAVRVLAAAGCQVVLVETVGVGQSEVEIAALADTTVVLMAPGMGDGIQAVKAGIMEIADLFVVNKADREGAAHLRRELRTATSLAARDEGAWRPPVLSTQADQGEGIEALVAAIGEHHAWQRRSGDLWNRRRRRARAEIEALALAALRRRWSATGEELDILADAVAAGTMDPYGAADQLAPQSP